VYLVKLGKALLVIYYLSAKVARKYVDEIDPSITFVSSIVTPRMMRVALTSPNLAVPNPESPRTTGCMAVYLFVADPAVKVSDLTESSRTKCQMIFKKEKF